MSSKSAAPNLTPTPRHSIEQEPPRPVVMVRSASRRLPTPLTSLVGRDAEIAAARSNLVDDGVRLLTLTGPGGVGKTRLALRIAEEVAAAFSDGVVFVPLAPITDPELVLPAVARELGLRQTAALSVAELLTSHLRQRRLLLILDNVEQVAGAAPRVAALLGACPGLSVLATSRTRLRVSGERRFPVSPLALPNEDGKTAARRRQDGKDVREVIAASPAVQLFVERAQAVEPHFVLDADNAPTVAAICRRLDGLPLAIELAAVHMRFLSAAELLARLAPALPLLAAGPTDAPDRLRTMRNAIAWSYNLLTPAERTLLRHLSVFVGGCTLAAAEAVAAEGSHRPPAPRTTRRRAAPPAEMPSFLETLAALVDASLVQRHDAAGESRLTMLETIREFAWEQLAASGELDAVATRHVGWCVHLAETVWQAGGVSHGRGLLTLEGDHPNLRAALEWLLTNGEATAALHLAGLLGEFWYRHGHLGEGQAWLERALAADDSPPTAARVEALVGLTMLLWQRDDLARAERLLDEAEAVARAAGDAGALAYARQHQGYVALFQGNLDLAVARGEECLASCAAIRQGFNCNGALWLLANATLARGENERATDLYERLLAAGRAGGDEISVANGHLGLARLAERRGELVPALAGYAEAAAVVSGSGDSLSACNIFEEAATTAVALGHMEPAVRLFAAVDALRAAVGAAPVFVFVPGRPRHEQALATARAALGEESFAALWAAGAALSLEEAVAEVRALAGQVSATTAAAREARPVALTGRERDVLRLLADGLGDKAIAAALGISRRTASQHVAAILTKLGAASRTAAVSRALRQGLLGISPPDSA